MRNVKHHASAPTFSLPLPPWRPPAQAQEALPPLEEVLRPQQVLQDPVGYQLKIPVTQLTFSQAQPQVQTQLLQLQQPRLCQTTVQAAFALALLASGCWDW
jgi:hypothetical protein